MSKDVKLIRKQIKNVLQEEGPNMFAQEMYKKLQEENTKRLKELEEIVKQALKDIDSRSKDVLSLIMRDFMSAQPAVKAQEEVKLPEQV